MSKTPETEEVHDCPLDRLSEADCEKVYRIIEAAEEAGCTPGQAYIIAHAFLHFQEEPWIGKSPIPRMLAMVAKEGGHLTVSKICYDLCRENLVPEAPTPIDQEKAYRH